MPPKASGPPGSGPQRPPRGRGGGRGGRGVSRGAPAARGGMQVVRRSSIAENVRALGVKRRDYGTNGRVIKVRMNSYEVTVPDHTLYQYDVTPDLSKKICQRLISKIREENPTIFTSPVFYDGRAILFSSHRLKLGPNGTSEVQEFNVVIDPPSPSGRAPRVHKVTIKHANASDALTPTLASINLHVLNEFVAGNYSQDNAVVMAEMALNIGIRALPQAKFPANTRCFFPQEGAALLGQGLEVRRGYFQSIRPAIGKVILNLDISSAAMYRPGPLITVCLDFLRQNSVDALSPQKGFSKGRQGQLQDFLSGVKVTTMHTGVRKEITIFGVAPASTVTFDHKEWGKLSVAAYFKRKYNVTIQYSTIACVRDSKNNILPMELCTVVPGQFYKGELSPDQTKAMVEFATLKPAERFKNIQDAYHTLAYGQSEYVRSLGITVGAAPLEVDARVLPAPTLKVHPDADQRKSTINPANGAWNMVGKKLFAPARLSGFMVVVFESMQRFPTDVCTNAMKGFVDAAKGLGIGIQDPSPYVKWVTNTKNMEETLKSCGRAYIDDKKKQTGNPKQPGPSLILAIVPPNSKDLYDAIKQFGIIKMGIATQCALSSKARKANNQYWTNVWLKVNVKLGGTNFIPNLAILDPLKPTIVMGADAIHPPPGPNTASKPSFTALVTSIDSNVCKYVASNGKPQIGRTEMIADLEAMCTHGFQNWKDYQEKVEKKRNPPERIFYFRDGVSEGEFTQVLKLELPRIRASCASMGWNPKITLIVVGKRHHHRGMTCDPNDADRSGNIPAGATIDKGIAHPVETDYYQYTHGGLLGTSRPAHYTMLHDENNLTADALQSLSYGLAHSFARATRSVSIPAPVYYADIICAQRSIHYDLDPSAQRPGTLQEFQETWLNTHPAQAGVMYWM